VVFSPMEHRNENSERDLTANMPSSDRFSDSKEISGPNLLEDDNSSGWFFVEEMIGKFALGLGLKLTQLEKSYFSGYTDENNDGNDTESESDPHTLHLIWEDFPRRCGFFVSTLKKWVALEEGPRERLEQVVMEWGSPPFSLEGKFSKTELKSSRLLEVLWSRTAGDILCHLIRYKLVSRGRRWEAVYELAVKHLTLRPVSTSQGSIPKELLSRLVAQAQLMWASVLGIACSAEPNLASKLLDVDDIPFHGWFFIDLSAASPLVGREVLDMLTDRLTQAKQDRATRLICLLSLERLLERLDFNTLARRDTQWIMVFTEVVSARIYKSAEQSAKTEELKAASLSLMLTILLRSPPDFRDGNFSSFFSKRVLRHLGEPRKVLHSMEIVLRSLRGPEFSRPGLAWDAFERYDPERAYTRKNQSPFSSVSMSDSAELMNIFVEVFERSKSKALAIANNSLSVGALGGLSIPNSGVTANTRPETSETKTIDEDHPQSHHVRSRSSASFSTIGAASASALRCTGSFSTLNPEMCVGGALGHSMTSTPGLQSLSKNLRLCKHLLLQIAAHDMFLLKEKILPSMLEVSEDPLKISAQAGNRLIVALRAVWDMYTPGHSVFRETAACLRSQKNTAQALAFAETLTLTGKLIPRLIKLFDDVVGIAEYGVASHPLIPTMLWDVSMGQRSSSSDGDVVSDPIGELLGYPFAWADPTRDVQADSPFSITTNGLVVEIHQLGNSHELFESTETFAIRTRNLVDKAGLDEQLHHAARQRSVFFKKKSDAALEVFRELLYTSSVLSCTPLLPKDCDPTKVFIPSAGLLLHADWSTATAVSHAYQRIICSCPRLDVRGRVLLKIVQELRKIVSGNATSVLGILSLTRQLTILLKLWRAVHCDDISALALLENDRNSLVRIGVALLPIPCATVRLHAFEILETLGCFEFERLAPALTKAEVLSYACASKSDCACGRIYDGSSGDIHRRKADVDFKGNSPRQSSSADVPPLIGPLKVDTMEKVLQRDNSQRSIEGKSSPSHLRSLSSNLSKIPRSPSRTEESKASLQMDFFASGSCAAFGDCYEFIPESSAPLITRDELFTWYRGYGSVQLNEELQPHDMKPAAHWPETLVLILKDIVENGDQSAQSNLEKVSETFLDWVSRLAAFETLDSEVRFFENVLRRTLVSACVTLAGCSTKALNVATQNLVMRMWDAAASLLPLGRTHIAVVHTLQELVGRSSHRHCLPKFIRLVLQWRGLSLKKLGNLSARAVASSDRKGSKFRRNNNKNNSPDENATAPVHVEKVTLKALRTMTLSLWENGKPEGWEETLKLVFSHVSALLDSKVLQESHWTLSMEFIRFVLQVCESLFLSLKDHEDMQAMIEMADLIWPRAERRSLWMFLQSLAGFDEILIFPVEEKTVPPVLANTSASGVIDGSKTIPANDFTRLRNLVTEAALLMLRVGPVSLGVVAPRPDENMWRWLYHGEQIPLESKFNQDKSCCPRFLATYLAAHWRVGDIESSGGGTFGPFVDKWFEEERSSGFGSVFCDAIFSSFSTAVSIWLFDRRDPSSLILVRPLERSALASLLLLAALHAFIHESRAIRLSAFVLFDAIAFSMGSGSCRELQVDGAIALRAKMRREQSYEDAAMEAMNLLAREFGVDLGPILLAELWARLPRLSSQKLRDVAVKVCTQFAGRPLKIVFYASLEDSLGLQVDASTSATPASSLASTRTSNESAGAFGLSRESSSSFESVRQSVQAGIQHSSRRSLFLQELWTCSMKVYDVDGDCDANLVLPLWMSLCSHQPSKVLRFLLLKIFDVNEVDKCRDLASSLLIGCSEIVFEVSPEVVFTNLIDNVFEASSVEESVKALLEDDVPTVKKESHDWAHCVLHFEVENTWKLSNSDVKNLSAGMRRVLPALTSCCARFQASFASAIPSLASYTLCFLGSYCSGEPNSLIQAEIYFLGALVSILSHERLHEQSDIFITDAELSTLRAAGFICDTLELSQIAVRAVAELLMRWDRNGDLLHLWMQSLLERLLNFFKQVSFLNPRLLEVALALYKELRQLVKHDCLKLRFDGILTEDECLLSWRLETLAMMRMFQFGVSNVMPCVVKEALNCLILLDLSGTSAGVHEALLNAFVMLPSRKEVELSYFSLLARVASGKINPEATPVVSIGRKLQDAICTLVLSIQDENGSHGDDLIRLNGMLDLFSRLYKQKICQIQLLSVAFTFYGAFSDSGSAILHLLQTIHGVGSSSGETLEALKSDSVVTQYEVICSVLSSFDELRFCEDYVAFALRQIEIQAAHEMLIQNLFEVTAALLMRFPAAAPTLSVLTRLAYSLDVPRKKMNLKEAAKNVLRNSFVALAEYKHDAAEDVRERCKEEERKDELIQSETHPLKAISRLMREESSNLLDFSGKNSPRSSTLKGSFKFVRKKPSDSGFVVSRTLHRKEPRPSSGSSLAIQTSRVSSRFKAESFVGGTGTFDEAKGVYVWEDEEGAEDEGAESRFLAKELPKRLKSPTRAHFQSFVSRLRFMESLLLDSEHLWRIEDFLVENPIIDTSWLDFAIHALDFRQNPDVESAERISKKFLQLDALDTLDINADHRLILIQAVQDENIDEYLFHPVLEHAIEYLEENLLGRYMRSPQFCSKVN